MMSLETIRSMAQQATREAARAKKVPWVPFDAHEIETRSPLPFPNLGDHCPKGWRLVEQLFCDSSGFGSDNEPALSQQQLRNKMKELDLAPETYGYGIVSVGQFQVYVGVYRKLAKGEK